MNIVPDSSLGLLESSRGWESLLKAFDEEIRRFPPSLVHRLLA